MSLEDCRERMSFGDVWVAMGLPDEKGSIRGQSGGKAVKIRSPFRADKTPGCSVYLAPDGRGRFKDFATGDCLDDVALIAHVRNCSMKDAVGIFHDLCGLSMGGAENSRGRSAANRGSGAAEKTAATKEKMTRALAARLDRLRAKGMI